MNQKPQTNTVECKLCGFEATDQSVRYGLEAVKTAQQQFNEHVCVTVLRERMKVLEDNQKRAAVYLHTAAEMLSGKGHMGDARSLIYGITP